MSHLSPETKAKLSSTIRGLRDRLITDFHNAVESAYRLSLPVAKAGLAEEQRVKRQRLEQWLDEQVRAEVKAKKLNPDEIRDRQLRTAEKLAAATLLNRLVVIKQMEAIGLIKPMIMTGGWQSRGYREFRDFAPDLCRDETEGFGTLLQLLYDELALEMPGLFGRVRLSSLFPVPASTLRAVIEALNDPGLQEAWRDDTTLGWVYQYWNDPEREELDAKLNAGGKVEPHEVASKTQMFTERYMVEWLLHNSLGQMWLAICRSQGWTAEVQADGTLDRLEERRRIWREKRERGEVALDELMPIEAEAEERWKYWVPQPLTEAAIASAPESIRAVKMLDPACGSGHFLVIAVGLLVALYQEEARHRGEEWSDREIVESILANNLYGVDIDARAVQIAAAALFLKAKSLCAGAELHGVNLVASDLNLSALPEDDPALVELRREVQEATGIPDRLTNQIVQALKGADQWGSLLKIDREVERAIAQYEESLVRPVQTSLFEPRSQSEAQGVSSEAANRKDALLEKLETFLSRRTRGDDLGLRLWGEQLTAGVRFIRMVRENAYDVVLANPPYQGAAKMEDAKFLVKHYPKGKSDLFSAFIERSLQLLKEGGLSAMITMRNWMFIQQFTDLREWLLDKNDLRALGDLSWGGFSAMKDNPVTMSIFQRCAPSEAFTVAIAPTNLDERVRSAEEIRKKIGGLIAGTKRFEFKSDRFAVIKEKPIVYWWDDEFLDRYAEIPKLGEISPARKGACTSDNTRFICRPWEPHCASLMFDGFADVNLRSWAAYIMGAQGKAWYEGLDNIIRWKNHGLEVKVFNGYLYKSFTRSIQNQDVYFTPGIAFSTIGANFSARKHRYKSVIDTSGSSVYPDDRNSACALMNSRLGRGILSALNPTVNFKNVDVNRLPLFPIESADEIFAQLDAAFTEHEAARETSVEFKQPGASCWNYAQQWAQQAVDREPGKPLPDWNPVYDQPTAANWVSYAIGVALGRFGANGEGILTQAPDTALPNGILYLSAYAGDRPTSKDSLNHPAAQPLKTAWNQHGTTIAKNKPLRDWLRLNFFKDVHLGLYEQRPIYLPLSSKNRSFVAYISIHRWADSTLQTLLADYLIPELRELEGETADLLETRSKGDRKQQAQAEERRATVQALHTELQAFITLIQQCAEQGAPPASPKDPPRQADAPFRMDLDDGVMVNSAALWCLLDSQWNKPKTWWSELCTAKGKKDYDWSHLAARYFPDRVDAKCQTDPSLAVAHGCFWKYHPAKAYEWELRLQDEIAPDFTIDEEGSDRNRLEFETNHPQLVADLREKEEKRRDRKYKKTNQLEVDFGEPPDDDQNDSEDT